MVNTRCSRTLHESLHDEKLIGICRQPSLGITQTLLALPSIHTNNKKRSERLARLALLLTYVSMRTAAMDSAVPEVPEQSVVRVIHYLLNITCRIILRTSRSLDSRKNIPAISYIRGCPLFSVPCPREQ